MVSEDSQHLRRLPKVHRLTDRRDRDEPREAQVFASIHSRDDVGKLVEVVSLRRLQWVGLEERDDPIPQVLESRDVVAVQILAMVVVPPVAIHLSTTEERTIRSRTPRLDAPWTTMNAG